MKIPPPFIPRRRQQAFTMAEMAVTIGIFMLLMGGIIYGYLYGCYLYQITKIKLGASDEARKAFIKLTDEIRSANSIAIGNGDLSSFTECGASSVQQGNAIMIYPGTDTNNWVRYWYQTNYATTNGLQTNYTKLLRTEDGANYALVIAHSITNLSPLFTSEDSAGNIVSNDLNNRVIGVSLQFYQIEYPIVNIGPSNYYDFYQLHTRITRRTYF